LGEIKVRVYLDSAIIIYAVEQVMPYASIIETRLSAPDIVCITSDLARMECRVKPIQIKNIELLKDYDYYFEMAMAEIIVLSRQVIDCATNIRAICGFKTPDSIHLASALVSRCDVFLTNDYQLNQFTEIAIEII
jgi:predicted nucleic acid-binding protein